MTKDQDPLLALADIKSMMEKSSRFVSLSGLSGVAAGIIALAGSYLAYIVMEQGSGSAIDDSTSLLQYDIGSNLFYIALSTLALALVAGVLFTYLKTKKLRQPLWDSSSRRMIINLGLPLLAGGFYLLKMMDLGHAELLAPGCLIFYGLALVNASKYTLGDIRYLGYIEVLLGVINLIFLNKGLFFWAVGFGVAHILYGAFMWNKYDKVKV